MSGQLNGQVALVTGGSRGIGRAICQKLAGMGAKVYVNFASNREAADETVRLCQPGLATAIGFNVADSAAVDGAIDTIIKENGRIDILVNNAGIAKDGLFIRMKNDDWDATLKTNLDGAFYCARAVSRHMLKARSGKIVNISSVVGEMGNIGQAPYVTSKAGLIGLTKALAHELASRGITVNAISPGFIETEMTGHLDEKRRELMLSRIPLGRMGGATEVASVVAFLASPEASYVTGQVLGVNGGMYM